MKRICIFIAAVFCMVLLSAKRDIASDIRDSEKVKFYVEGVVDSVENADCIQNGDDTIVIADGEFAKTVYGELGNVIAITVITELSMEKAVCKYALNIKMTERVQDIKTVYGFSNQVDFRSAKLNGEKVNMQISSLSYGTVIGFPIIMTDY